ncbi:MAG: outer membrane beta-barrel protein [Gammaproteobacteria bacterium]|jgi:opacity protein-like surface antigen|nr:outer membrane beta-barrel protein [Gammaproteobacteria bacterium]
MHFFNKLIFCSLVFVSPAYCAPYLSGQLGATDVTLTYTTPYSFSDSHKITPISRVAGGYLWENDEHFKYGLEAGFENFHSVKEDFHQIELKYHQFQIDTLGVIDYYPGKRLDLFVKAGAAYAKQTASMSALQISGSGSYNKVFPKAVVGVGYNVTQNVNLNISLENNFNYESPKRDLLAGVKYTFH